MLRLVLIAAFCDIAVSVSVDTTVATSTMVIGDLAQGSEFTKCILTSDLNSKSLADTVTVTDRNTASGCCPSGYAPGIKHYNKYWGAMIICGFQDNGAISTGTSSSNGVTTCNYNKCYVVKMDVTCADSSKMTLDGCCPKGQYTADCKSYTKSWSVNNQMYSYCLSYNKNYKMEGTSATADDQQGGTLDLSKLYLYTACPVGTAYTQTFAAPAPTPGGTKMILNNLAQGSEFTKCIRITDFNTKGMSEEVETLDRSSTSGCCPDGFIPGIKHYNKYWGAQIVCGFKDDGSVAMSTSSSNGAKSCAYNKCYVVNLNHIDCADGTKMKLDGCCSSWTSDCKMYSKSQSFFSQSVSYCLSYTKNYKLEGTSSKTDDVTTTTGGSSLSLSELQAYTVCGTGFGTGGTATTGSSPSPAPTPTPTSTITGDTVVIGSLAQGQEFTSCIKITDFNTKSLADAVQITARDTATGCCPEGYIPGIKHYNKYWGSMIVCGFKTDGSVSISTSSSNGAKTCTYNKCYVVKMDITCADSSKMTLDGCCPDGQYTADCKEYSKSASFFNEKVNYCLSYQKNYELEGTSDKTDDQTSGGMLDLNALQAYTVCPGGFGGTGQPGLSTSGGTSSAPSPSSSATGDNTGSGSSPSPPSSVKDGTGEDDAPATTSTATTSAAAATLGFVVAFKLFRI